MAKKTSSGNIIDIINDRLGSKLVCRASEIKLQPLKTGILCFDDMFDCGGIPRGDVVEIYGEEGTGKSSFCLQYIANVQKEGGTVAYIDREGKFNDKRAQDFGIDTESLIFDDTNDTEQMSKIIFAIAETGIVDLIILDSLAAGGPETKEKKEHLDIMVGQNALLNNLFFRKWLAIQNHISNEIRNHPDSNQRNSVLVVVNQTRETISLFATKVRPGGRGKDYTAIARILITKEEFFDKQYESIGMSTKALSGAEVYGMKTKLFMEKNQAGKPFKSCSFQFKLTENAFDKSADMLNFLILKEFISRSGKWFYIADDSFINKDIMNIADDVELKFDGNKNLQDFFDKLIKNEGIYYDKLGIPK